MNKKEIINKLNNINIDKSKFIVIGQSALVLLGIKRNSPTIEIASNSLVKSNEIINKKNYYDLNRIEKVLDFQVANIYATLDYLKAESDNKKLIKDLSLRIASLDNYKYERELRAQEVKFIAGVDEVGRGPLIGPVVTACVVLPEKFELDGLTDSKKLSLKKREYFYNEIKKQALGIGIGQCSASEIDKYNIYEATKIAMKRAINNCLKECQIDHVLIDAMKLDISIPTTSIIKGDIKSITISAASVIAKVTRDNMMYSLAKSYPMYHFDKNVGYPTKEHLEAINKYGILKEHRKTFGPVKEYIKKNSINFRKF